MKSIKIDLLISLCLWLIGFSLPSLANSAPICSTVMELESSLIIASPYKTGTPSPSKLESLRVPFRNQTGETVYALAQREGLFDLIYIFKLKQYSDWFSAESLLDPQGDPRMLPLLLGKDMSEELGYKIINNTTMEIPSSSEFIFRLNQMKLKEPKLADFFPIEFYQQASPLSVISYLWRFAYEGKLPISSSGVPMLHDLNFHILSIALIHPKKLDLLREKAREFLSFLDFVNSKKDINLQEKVIIDSSIKQISSEVDGFLGGASLVIYQEIEASIDGIFSDFFKPEFSFVPEKSKYYSEFFGQNKKTVTTSKEPDYQYTNEANKRYKQFKELFFNK